MDTLKPSQPYFTKMWAVVRFQVEGWHNWPQAPEHREYLRWSHRHMFHLEIKVEVRHTEREIEYHDLREEVLDFFPDRLDRGPMSCESMALAIIGELKSRFGERDYIVKVFEDGENGAEVTYTPAIRAS